MLQHTPLHLGVPTVGNQRLQRPEGIEHIALFAFLLQLQLFSRGLLAQLGGTPVHHEMELGEVFLQHGQAWAVRRSGVPVPAGWGCGTVAIVFLL